MNCEASIENLRVWMVFDGRQMAGRNRALCGTAGQA
jgi:hypothetical protein